MQKLIKKYGICFLFIFVICIFLYSLYNYKTESDDITTVSGFAFDTAYTINVYKGGSKSFVDSCVTKCSEYEAVFSPTMSNSELKNINDISKAYYTYINSDSYRSVHGSRHTNMNNSERNKCIRYINNCILDNTQEQTDTDTLKDTDYYIDNKNYIHIAISKDLKNVISYGIQYGKLSNGKFDITIEPVSSLWDFSSDNPSVPSGTAITKAIKLVNYKSIEVHDTYKSETTSNPDYSYELVIKKAGIQIDLGAIAKGYIADCIKDYLQENGVKKAMINLGGNVVCFSDDSTESFNIGVRKPFAKDSSSTVCTIKISNASVVTSGIYERYFKTSDGKLYHHILDSSTGYPVDNNLASVTIVAKKSANADALSTTCFSLGLDKGLNYINNLNGTEALFITKDNKKYYSDGFKKLMG